MSCAPSLGLSLSDHVSVFPYAAPWSTSTLIYRTSFQMIKVGAAAGRRQIFPCPREVDEQSGAGTTGIGARTEEKAFRRIEGIRQHRFYPCGFLQGIYVDVYGFDPPK